MNAKLMKKLLALVLLGAAALGLFTACSGTTSKSFTFTVDTGDKIKIKLNTTDGYDISAQLPFTISFNGETLSQGTFVYAETYQQYVDLVNSDQSVQLLDSGEKDGIEYIFWNYNDSEFNYAILVKNSNTAIILGNPISAESATECFNRLTFTLE